MKFKKKNSEYIIHVLSKKNKVLLNKHGMVIITKGNYCQSTTINPDVLKNDFIIPDDIIIDD